MSSFSNIERHESSEVGCIGDAFPTRKSLMLRNGLINAVGTRYMRGCDLSRWAIQS